MTWDNLAAYIRSRFPILLERQDFPQHSMEW